MKLAQKDKILSTDDKQNAMNVDLLLEQNKLFKNKVS